MYRAEAILYSEVVTASPRFRRLLGDSTSTNVPYSGTLESLWIRAAMGTMAKRVLPMQMVMVWEWWRVDRRVTLNAYNIGTLFTLS